MTDDDFLAAFEARTLPKSAWTQAAHVRMAWLYLSRLPFAEALYAIRHGIRRYNAATGSDGYHETVTVAYSLLIHARLTTGEDFAAFCSRNPDLFAGRADLLGRHYDRVTLAGAKAKGQFVWPDHKPLPGQEMAGRP